MTPACSSSIHARYGFSSWCGSVATIESGNSTPVSTTRNSEIPSTPRCQEIPHASIHVCFDSNWNPGVVRVEGPQQPDRQARRSDRRQQRDELHQVRTAPRHEHDEDGPDRRHDDEARQDRERRRAAHVDSRGTTGLPWRARTRRAALRLRSRGCRRSCGCCRSGPCGSAGRSPHGTSRPVDGAVDDGLVEPGDRLEQLAPGSTHERAHRRVVSDTRRRATVARSPSPCAWRTRRSRRRSRSAQLRWRRSRAGPCFRRRWSR